MTFEIFMMGLLLVSVLTGLFTEAIKGWLLERGKKFYCNALTGYVAAGLSVLDPTFPGQCRKYASA